MAPATLLPLLPGSSNNQHAEGMTSTSTTTSMFWRCRDGPLVAHLACSSSSEQAERGEAEQHERPDGAALAAFAAASRDSWLVARTVVAALSPCVLLPEAIARSFPAVRELDLSRVRRLTASDIAMLPEVLPGLTSLRLRASGGGGGVSPPSSSFSSSSSTATPLREAALAPIGRLTRLERLSVRGAHRCRWSVLNRWHALKSLRSLELVGLSNADAAAASSSSADGAASALAAFLAATGAATRLTRLVLGDAMGLSFMGDAGLMQLGVESSSPSSSSSSSASAAAAAAAGAGTTAGAAATPPVPVRVPSTSSSCCCPLRSLDLSGCIDVTDTGLSAALRASAPTLEELSLHNCLRVTGAGLVAALAGAAAALPQRSLALLPAPPPPSLPLRRLSLRGCGHLDDAALAPALARLGHLTWLSLQSCSGVRGGVLLALAGGGGAGGGGGAIAEASAGARAVAVAGRPPQTATAAAAASGASGESSSGARRRHQGPGCPRLRYLNLSYCSGLVLGEDGRPPAAAAATGAAAAGAAAAVAPVPPLAPLEALARLPELESLDLSGCHGVGPGALGGLERCGALTELRLAGWMGPAVGAAAAAGAAAASPSSSSSSSSSATPLPRSLRSVDLRGARFASPQALAALLRRLPGRLASLDLSRAAVSVPGAGAGAGAAGAAAAAQAEGVAQSSVLAAPIEAIGAQLTRLEALDLSDVRVCAAGGGGGGGWQQAAHPAASSSAPLPPLARRADLAPLGRLARLRVLRLSGIACDGGEEDEVEVEQGYSAARRRSSPGSATDAAAAALGRSLLLGRSSQHQQQQQQQADTGTAYPQGGGPRALRGIAPSMMDGAYGRGRQAAAGAAAADSSAATSGSEKHRKRPCTTHGGGSDDKEEVEGTTTAQEHEDDDPVPERKLALVLASRGGDSAAADAATAATATNTAAAAPQPPLPQQPPAHALWLAQLRCLREVALTDSPGADAGYLLALAAGPGASLRAADLSGCRRLASLGVGAAVVVEEAAPAATTSATAITPTRPADPDPFFLACFSRLSALEALDLSGCARLGDGAAAAAAASLPSLRTLALRSCPAVGDAGLAAFGAAGTCRATRLRELALSGSRRVTCEGAAALVAHADDDGTWAGKGGDASASASASAAASGAAQPPHHHHQPPLQHLESLSLDHCPNLSDSGAEALALGGKRGRLPRLRRLSVRGCWRLGDGGAGALLRPSALPSLARLSVEGCHRLTARCCELAAESDGLLSPSPSSSRVQQPMPREEEQQEQQEPPRAPAVAAATARPRCAPVVPSSGVVRVECVGRRPTTVERVPLAAWGEQSRRSGGGSGGGGGGGGLGATAATAGNRARGGGGNKAAVAALFHIY